MEKRDENLEAKGDGGKSREIMKEGKREGEEGGKEREREKKTDVPRRSNNAENELYCTSFTCKREEETVVMQQRDKG